MSTRRGFLTHSIFAGTGLGLGFLLGRQRALASNPSDQHAQPTVSPFTGGLLLSTWDFGMKANAAGWPILSSGGKAIDAAETSVKVIESDFTNLSVGLGGLPDRDGHTTLDACIMDEQGRAGSVSFLEKIEHPISVARMVMEKTPHVMLVGEGAQRFALEQGFALNDFQSAEAQKAYQEWLKTSEYRPIVNIENHDTIGLVAMDKNGDLSGCCTTSGLAYKMRGRVGDSPVIGAGLFVDNEIGAATSTGLGEAVLRTCGSYLVVECMRRGSTPQEACEEAVQRIQKKHNNIKDFQVGFIAVNKAGDVGGYAVQKGFSYALCKSGKAELIPAGSLF